MIRELLLEGWAQDIDATVYFANEPNYDDVNGYTAPSKFQVWRYKNIPTFIVAYGRFRWLVGAIICDLTSHDWVDESYGNPESGCMAGHCNRCGYSFKTILY